MKKLLALFFVFALCDSTLTATKADAQITLIQFQDVAACRSWVSIPDQYRIMVIYYPGIGPNGTFIRYVYDNTSTATDDGVNIIKPDIVTTGRWKWFSADPGGSPASTESRAAYGTGTAYSLTTTSAKVTMGTTSPSVTLPSAGTYILMSNLNVDYASLTTVGAATGAFKLRRTNNTAADITNATATFTGTIATLLTGPAGDPDIQSVIYTTTTAGDVIEMWGSRGNNVTVGNLNVTAAWIVAVKLY